MLKGDLDGARIAGGAGRMTVDSPAPTPIVFVPGVMGSRLSLGNEAWDPDSKVNMLHWAALAPVDAAKLLDVQETAGTVKAEPIAWDDRLAALWKIVDPGQHKDFYGKQRGWSGVARDFYYELLVRLELHFNSYPFVPGAHPVYAFGYDWRRSNAASGKDLASRIDAVLGAHPGAKHVVLVTHSMGGLVARHAVHAKGGGAASKVKGVVHVVQPVHGAVQAYRRFAEGVDADRHGLFDLEGRVMAGILGGSWWGYTLLMSGTEGPLQLLPNHVYGGWLVDGQGVPVPQGNVYDVYSGKGAEGVIHEIEGDLAERLGYGKLGDSPDGARNALERAILAQGLPWDAGDIEKTRAKRVLDVWDRRCEKLRAGVQNAKAFHEMVAPSAHPSTFMLYAGQRRTEVGYDWSKDEGERLVYAGEGGDGTVPVASAKGLDAIVEKAWGTALPGPITPHRDTGDQEHSAVFGDAAVVEQVELLAFFLIRLEKPPEKIQKECFLQAIDVECEHAAKRGFKMKLPAAKEAPRPVNVLEIVAGGAADAEKVSAKASFASARCAKHGNSVWTVSGPGPARTFTAEACSLDLAYGEVDIKLHKARWLWPWNEKPAVYKLSPGACHSPADAVLVRVFPAIEPSISFQFELDTNDRVKSQMAKARAAGFVDTSGAAPSTEWKLGFSAKLTYGSRVSELGAEMKGKIEKLASINALVKKAIDRFSECFYRYTGVTLYPVFPKLSLEYSGKFKEIDRTGRVGAEWGLTFKANPLIGITAKIDALKAIISALKGIPALTALANGLDWLRTKAKEHDQVLDLTLSFSGTISGEIDAKKTAKGPASFKGAVTGKVQVAIAAKVSLGGKAAVSSRPGSNLNDEDAPLGVEVGGEAKASTGLFVKLEGNSDEEGVYGSGKAGILGCRIELVAWASVKVFWEVKESYEKEFSLWGDIDLLKSDKHYLVRRDEAG